LRYKYNNSTASAHDEALIRNWNNQEVLMLNFTINTGRCTRCGQCIADCPARIIIMQDGVPTILPEKETACYKCQHCLAVCPTGAVSILGVKPSTCRPLKGNYPAPDKLEMLIKGRRSIRKYKDENLPAELLQRLFDVSCHAPSGMNQRQVHFTLIDDREKMGRFRAEIMEGLARMVRENRLPAGMEFFAHISKAWGEKVLDVIFRGAPHLVIATAPKSGASPAPDCLIALSYFELFAQSLGVGTVWNGMAKWAISDLLPESRKRLEIPEDHIIGYAMSFGMPAVQFARTVQHGKALIHRPQL